LRNPSKDLATTGWTSANLTARVGKREFKSDQLRRIILLPDFANNLVFKEVNLVPVLATELK
jgi:hypothetical protein